MSESDALNARELARLRPGAGGGPDWRDAVQAVAPMVATALGGPLAGAAAAVVGRVLLGRGEDAATSLPEALEAVQAATTTPEGLARLKEAEARILELKTQLTVELGRQQLEDRKDARARDVSARDGMNTWLAKMTVFTFVLTAFAVVVGSYFILTNRDFLELAKSNFEMTLAVNSMLTLIVKAVLDRYHDTHQYYFGSSAGSRDKGDTLNAVVVGQGAKG
jgi:hypothetical protein